jgi:hypothetical protein
MSALEAAAAVSGLIGFTIAVIQGSIQIYGAVKDKSGIPERLRKVSDALPSLLEVLEGAKAQFDKDHPPKQAWVEVEKDVKRCQESCQELHDILERTYPKADAGTLGRVFKNMGNLVSRKSKTAEELLKDIHGYLEILKQRQIITNTEKLDDIKNTIDELFPASGIIQNTNSGINVGHNNGQISNQSGGSGNMFTGPNGNFTFNSK